jgi:hypothetical protein
VRHCVKGTLVVHKHADISAKSAAQHQRQYLARFERNLIGYIDLEKLKKGLL